jgi:hypothetical protein
MPDKNRYLVFIAVAGAHAVILGMLLGSSRTISLVSSTGIPLTGFLVMPAARRRSPLARPRLGRSMTPVAPLAEPITLAPPAVPLGNQSRGPIDWDAAARKAAAAVLRRRKQVTFGFPEGGKSALTLGVPSPHTPAHHAGESDRTATGEEIEWTSDRCYVVSDPPSLAEPDFLKNARITHAGCLPPDGPSPGELFKSLPAYKKHHPQ